MRTEIKENGKKYLIITEAEFIECRKCNGKGRINCYSHINHGICFTCGGEGRKGKTLEESIEIIDTQVKEDMSQYILENGEIDMLAILMNH